MTEPDCCDTMTANLEVTCDQHKFRIDCPDVIMYKYGENWGIPIHDGGMSYIKVYFCPWCGARLKSDKK